MALSVATRRYFAALAAVLVLLFVVGTAEGGGSVGFGVVIASGVYYLAWSCGALWIAGSAYARPHHAFMFLGVLTTMLLIGAGVALAVLQGAPVAFSYYAAALVAFGLYVLAGWVLLWQRERK